jgi:hypothetical protein
MPHELTLVFFTHLVRLRRQRQTITFENEMTGTILAALGWIQ